MSILRESVKFVSKFRFTNVFPYFSIGKPRTKLKPSIYWAFYDLIAPGDIILTHTKNDLSNKLIRLASLFSKGGRKQRYSHSMVYIGNHKVVHAVMDGVKEDDLLDVLERDFLCILRPLTHDFLKDFEALNLVKSKIGAEYDVRFDIGGSSYYCHELSCGIYLRALGVDIPRVRSFGKEVYLGDSIYSVLPVVYEVG